MQKETEQNNYKILENYTEKTRTGEELYIEVLVDNEITDEKLIELSKEINSLDEYKNTPDINSVKITYYTHMKNIGFDVCFGTFISQGGLLKTFCRKHLFEDIKPCLTKPKFIVLPTFSDLPENKDEMTVLVSGDLIISEIYSIFLKLRHTKNIKSLSVETQNSNTGNWYCSEDKKTISKFYKIK